MLIFLISVLIALASGFVILWKVEYIKDAEMHGDLPEGSLSIIIPAFNEEKRIGALLDSLKGQSYKPLEILVVDDHSLDNTVEVAKDYEVKIIRSLDLRDGWIGKARACWSGALEAKGDMILFLDADTCLSDCKSLEKIVCEYSRQGQTGILSVQPYHTVYKIYENYSAIFNIISLAGMNIFTPYKRKLDPAGAFGPCVLCNRKEYFSLGGHEKIKGTVMDDLALGNIFLKSGLPVNNYAGKGVITYRMYPEGLGNLVEGWTKNFGAGSRFVHPGIFLMIFAWVTGGFASALLLLLFNVSVPLNLLLYFLYMLQFFALSRKAGNFKIFTFIIPFVLHHLFFICIFIWSLFRTKIIKNVTWRGRKIDT